MDAYTNLNDTVFHLILLSRDPRLQEAQAILQDIQRRKLYKCVGETVPITGNVVVKKVSACVVLVVRAVVLFEEQKGR